MPRLGLDLTLESPSSLARAPLAPYLIQGARPCGDDQLCAPRYGL